MGNQEILGNTETQGRGSSGALIEMDQIPTSPDEVLDLFGEQGKYEGMLTPEEVEIVRSQLEGTASEDNTFGDNILISPYPETDGGCFIEVQYFTDERSL